MKNVRLHPEGETPGPAAETDALVGGEGDTPGGKENPQAEEKEYEYQDVPDVPEPEGLPGPEQKQNQDLVGLLGQWQEYARDQERRAREWQEYAQSLQGRRGSDADDDRGEDAGDDASASRAGSRDLGAMKAAQQGLQQQLADLTAQIKELRLHSARTELGREIDDARAAIEQQYDITVEPDKIAREMRQRRGITAKQAAQIVAREALAELKRRGFVRRKEKERPPPFPGARDAVPRPAFLDKEVKSADDLAERTREAIRHFGVFRSEED